MSEHPTPRELWRFVSGTLAGARFRGVLAHLARCRECSGRVAPAFCPESVDEESPVEAGPEYDEPVERAIRGALRRGARLDREKSAAAPALEALRRGTSFEDLPEAEERRLRGIPQVEILLELSRSQRHRDPGRMIELAELALFAARRLEPRRYGSALLADLRARVWGEVANAYRVADDLFPAEMALENAVSWAKRGGGDPFLTARLGELAASLWSDLRRFPLAIQALKKVGGIYQELNEVHLAGRALIGLGISRGYNDEPEQAILDLLDGLGQIDREREPGLVLAAWHAVACNLVECGRFRQARIVVFGSRELYLQDGNLLNLLRLSWLEGRIYAGRGAFEQAATAFQKTRGGFEEIGQHYDAALASLDLAMVWARQERRDDLRKLTAEMVGTFRRHGIAREAVAALLLARQDCGRSWVTGEELHDRLKAVSLLVLELQHRRRRPEHY